MCVKGGLLGSILSGNSEALNLKIIEQDDLVEKAPAENNLTCSRDFIFFGLSRVLTFNNISKWHYYLHIQLSPGAFVGNYVLYDILYSTLLLYPK